MWAKLTSSHPNTCQIQSVQAQNEYDNYMHFEFSFSKRSLKYTTLVDESLFSITHHHVFKNSPQICFGNVRWDKLDTNRTALHFFYFACLAMRTAPRILLAILAVRGVEGTLPHHYICLVNKTFLGDPGSCEWWLTSYVHKPIFIQWLAKLLRNCHVRNFS